VCCEAEQCPRGIVDTVPFTVFITLSSFVLFVLSIMSRIFSYRLSTIGTLACSHPPYSASLRERKTSTTSMGNFFRYLDRADIAEFPFFELILCSQSHMSYCSKLISASAAVCDHFNRFIITC
jgi:hypothetical protein